MKKSILFMVLAFIFFSCKKSKEAPPEQTQTSALPEFNKVYGGTNSDNAAAIITSLDGGYVMVGSTSSNDGDVSGHHDSIYYSDAWIVKLNKRGIIEWQKAIGGSNSDELYSIASTMDGNYVLAGYSGSNDGDVSGLHGYYDGWIVKINDRGTILWQKSIGGSKWDEFHSIIETMDGGYVVAGRTESTDGDVNGNHGESDALVLKLDNDGNIVWQRVLGGSANDASYSIIQSTDGGYLMAGYTESNDGDAGGNHGKKDVWIVKLDKTGTILWQKEYGGAIDDISSVIASSLDGGYIVLGGKQIMRDIMTGSYDQFISWIMKLDSDGNLLWQNPQGTTGREVAKSLTYSLDSNYVIAGSIATKDLYPYRAFGVPDAWIAKFDKDGNRKWVKMHGGSADDAATSILTRTDSSYVIAGFSDSNDGDVIGIHGQFDAWVFTMKDQ